MPTSQKRELSAAVMNNAASGYIRSYRRRNKCGKSVQQSASWIQTSNPKTLRENAIDKQKKMMGVK